MAPITTAVADGIDIVFSFDTTGSMYPCLSQVRRNVRELCEKLFSKIPNLRIGIIAHGDYCDRRSTYVTKILDLTTDRNRVAQFITNVERTGGGDAEECYELVLNEARSLTWRAGRSRVLVLVGDDLPHGKNDRANESGLDWRNEAAMLKECQVRVYSVQCLGRSYATNFYREVARITDGLALELHQFQNIELLLLGVAYKQESPEALSQFENQVRGQMPFTRNVTTIFDTLAGRKVRENGVRKDGLVPVTPGRFQSFDVPGEPSIRDFVEGMGITFQKGRGFYPLTVRKELIQEKKEVVIEDLATGDMFTGSTAREMIGLPYGSRGEVKPNPLPGYRVWVQSTSVNRTLRGGRFLYEVPER